MKRITPGVAAMLMTFALGAGVDRLIRARSEANTAPMELAFPVVAETVPRSEKSRIILDYDDETFYPNGTYYILGLGPAEFSEFFSFEIDYSEFIGDRPVPYMRVNTNAAGGSFNSHPVPFGFVTPRRLVFITSADAITRVEYLFDGEFIRSDFDAVANNDKAVVRGTLTKMKNGEKIAESVLSFRMVRHGC